MNELDQMIKLRDIKEVLHFTTNTGLVGILSINELLARSKLSEQYILEYIVKRNAKFRSDPEWTNYINLSISRINTSFFGYSQTWHKEPNNYWVILSFKPDILTHPNVYFTSTNNIYKRECKREIGVKGMNLAFQQNVLSKNGVSKSRTPDMPNNWSTCEEAEILYPGRLSLDNLNCIYVQDVDTYDLACAALAITNIEFTIKIEPNKFKGIQ